jgi:hypothetical protein
MLRRVVWYKFTDVSEELTASIIRAMMEAASTSEAWKTIRLHGATSQKTVIFILAAVRTSDLTKTRFSFKI